MINRCKRCGEREELRKGSTTGERRAGYVRLKQRVNASGIVILNPRPTLSNPLCLACLKELDSWLSKKTA